MAWWPQGLKQGWISLPRVGPGVSKSMSPEPGTLPTRPPSCQEQAGESSAVRGSEGSAGLLLVGADGREGWARCWEPGWEKTRCTVWWPARPRPARAAGSLTACQDATCHRLLSQLRMRQPELLGSRHRTSPRAGWPSRPAGFSRLAQMGRLLDLTQAVSCPRPWPGRCAWGRGGWRYVGLSAACARRLILTAAPGGGSVTPSYSPRS